MTTAGHLLDAYAAWRQLTERETSALQTDDWTAVAECQSAKESLRLVINALSAEAALSSHFHPENRQIGAALEELITLEQANQQLLETKARASTHRNSEVLAVQFQLGRLHRSYAAPAPPLWQSYS